MGRHARLELTFSHRDGRTVLTHAYAEPPFRIGHSFEVGKAAYVIVACTGPGIFAGDRLHQRLTVERGARVLLASQSALQVHPSEASEAAQMQQEYHVHDGGELYAHWDPVIPFAGARLVQRTHLHVARGSRLYWSDLLMAGRASRGEAWQFTLLDHELRLDVDGALAYLERYRVEPQGRGVRRRWMAGEAPYVGTTLVHHPRATPAVAETLQRRLDQVEGVTAGIDVVERAVLVGRLLASTGTGCAHARTVCRDTVLNTIVGDPQLVLRR